MNRAVVFDLDDTLYLEREFVFSGFGAVSEYVADGRDPDRETVFSYLWRQFEDGIRGDNFDRLVERFDLRVPVEDLVAVYRSHEPTLSLLPDSIACLEQLPDLCLGLITDGVEAKQQNKIAALNLSEHMDHIFISGRIDGDSEKPSKAMFELFLEESRFDPRSVTYVGDNAGKDFGAPNELGMGSVWIRRPVGEYAEIEPASPSETPDLTITNLRQLPPLLEVSNT